MKSSPTAALVTARRTYPRTRPDLVVIVLIGLLLTLGLHSHAAADAPAIPAGDWTLVVNGAEAADVGAGIPLRLHSADTTLDGAPVRTTTPNAAR